MLDTGERALNTLKAAAPKGCGKPRESESLAAGRCIRLMDQHKLAFDALGGVNWLRTLLRTAIDEAPDYPPSSWANLTKAAQRSIRLCDSDFDSYTLRGSTQWLRRAIEWEYLLCNTKRSG